MTTDSETVQFVAHKWGIPREEALILLEAKKHSRPDPQ